MQIVITRDELLARFGNGMDQIGKRGLQIMSRALHHGADRVKTVVLHELQEVTGVKKYGTIVKATHSYMQTPLSWVMTVRGKGLPIEEFDYTLPKNGPFAANLAKVRWSAHEHWMVQKRTSEGRWQAITTDTKPIVVSMWQRKIPFYESRLSDKDDTPLTRRLPGRGWRMIYGPNLPNEVVSGTPAQAFAQTVKTQVLDSIGANIMALLPGGGGMGGAPAASGPFPMDSFTAPPPAQRLSPSGFIPMTLKPGVGRGPSMRGL